MSADTFHAAIERQMRKRNLVDWKDLTNCVKMCLTEPRHALVVIDMRPEDFYDIKLTNRRNLSVSLYIFYWHSAYMYIEELSIFVVEKWHQPFAAVATYFKYNLVCLSAIYMTCLTLMVRQSAQACTLIINAWFMCKTLRLFKKNSAECSAEDSVFSRLCHLR